MLRLARQRGFNITEGMITLAVIALLIALALPSMTDWIRASHVRGTAEAVLDGLQRARMEAMKRNQTVTFWLVSASGAAPDATCALSSSSAAWVVSVDDPSGECDEAPSATSAPRLVAKYAPGPAAADLTVTALAQDGESAATSVSFNGLGQVDRRSSGHLARLDIAHSDSSVRKLRIQVSNNGGVRMCDPAVDADGDPRKCL